MSGVLRAMGAVDASRTRVRRLVIRSVIVWTIAIVETLLLGQAIAFWIWANNWFASEFAIPSSAAIALVGALIASKQPANRFGWFLLAMPVPGLIAFLCSEYTDLVHLANSPFPDEIWVTWVGNWAWTPSFGIGISMLTVRFPDGLVPGRWRFVDLIAFAGTAILAGGLAWISFPGAGQPSPLQLTVVSIGLGLIALGAVAAVWSLHWRYRHGDKELRLQLKWMLLTTIVMAFSLIVAAILQATFYARFDWVLAPFYAALICVPVAIGVAILRHHLFDIDLIISRTLVYVLVTGILGGLYIGVIELMQQVSILYTGQRSETAIVLTAFVVAGAFRPIEKWSDHTIERRFRGGDGAARLHAVSATAESVIRVVDPHRFAHWLVDESAAAFGAEGAVLYLDSYHETAPFHTWGNVRDQPGLDLSVQHDGHNLGRLVLGRRRGGIDYSHRDVEALKRSTAALGAALVVAANLGHLKHAVDDGSAPPRVRDSGNGSSGSAPLKSPISRDRGRCSGRPGAP